MESWNEKAEHLFGLMKKVSDFYGGDDVDFLNEYWREKIEEYKHDLDIPLKCFEDLVKCCNKNNDEIII